MQRSPRRARSIRSAPATSQKRPYAVSKVPVRPEGHLGLKTMNVAQAPNPKFTDLQLLGRLKGLSWLSSAQLKRLDDSMSARNVKHEGIIFEERGALSLDTHILLSGTAELSYLQGRRSRVVAILSPNVMFRVPLMPRGIDHNFQWTALSDCRVAELSTEHFINITLGILPADFARVADNGNGRLGYMLGRYPSFLGLGLLERVAVALLELAFEFGVQDTRGVLLRITVTQKQLGDLVGASRAKVGQVLIDLERRKVVIREGRQLAVIVRSLEALVRSAAQQDA
jgi:CRP-like cAMP-binding protein